MPQPGAIPEGYAAVPVNQAQRQASLRLCVLVRREPDPVAGHLVVLRDTIDAQVFLGCLTDSAGIAHQWLELWVQNLDGLAEAAPTCVEALSNDSLDKRWASHVKAAAQMDAQSLLRTGWESEHPAPMLIDPAKLEPVELADAQGRAWRLCTDDQKLRACDLPAYSTSVHRYLHQPDVADGPLIPVTRGAPTNPRTRPLEEVAGKDRKLVPLNLGGGLMMVRPHGEVELEAFIDALGGAAAEQTDTRITHGRSKIDLGHASILAGEAGAFGGATAVSATGSAGGDGRLFMGFHGRWGQLVETFYLKLRLLADAVHQVAALTKAIQRPLLSITPASFQVQLGDPSVALPFLWGCRLRLMDGGDAVALPIKTGDADYYLPGSTSNASIYRAESASEPLRGTASFRLRQVVDNLGGPIVADGTFTTQERLAAASQDLAWIRLDLKGGRVDLYGRLTREEAMAKGEWRYRTVPQKLPPDVVAELRAAEGISMPRVRFEIIPLLSTPCDLYALAVLAVRTLLVNDDNKLALALDETLSLARQVEANYDGTRPLPQRIADVFRKDARFLLSLGPQRLVHQQVSPDDAFDLVPQQIWFEALAAIITMLPGVGPDSLCRDYGDAPFGGIHRVYDPLLARFEKLLTQMRSLIVIDWRYNREVHRVIRQLLV